MKRYEDPRPTVPCKWSRYKWCDNRTSNIVDGVGECDRCWELRIRIGNDLEQATAFAIMYENGTLVPEED